MRHGRPLLWMAAGGIALGACALLGCAAGAPKSAANTPHPPVKTVPPRPGPDFPNPESFYPVEPKRHFIEGTTVLHFCTDETGRLSDTPTVAGSSGNADLDSAAVLLATAGNGHYLAASRAGIAVPGCGKFGVRFVLFRDPRWPTISAHVLNADARFVESLQAWSRDWGMSAPLAMPTTAADQLALFREAARKAAGGRETLLQLLNQYLASLDEASAASDVSESERQAFLIDWEPRRARLQQALTDAGSELRRLISVLNDTVSLLETLPANATAETLKGKQRARWLALTNQGRMLSEQFNAALRVIQLASPNRAATVQAADPDSGPGKPR